MVFLRLRSKSTRQTDNGRQARQSRASEVCVEGAIPSILAEFRLFMICDCKNEACMQGTVAYTAAHRGVRGFPPGRTRGETQDTSHTDTHTHTHTHTHAPCLMVHGLGPVAMTLLALFSSQCTVRTGDDSQRNQICRSQPDRQRQMMRDRQDRTGQIVAGLTAWLHHEPQLQLASNKHCPSATCVSSNG